MTQLTSNDGSTIELRRSGAAAAAAIGGEIESSSLGLALTMLAALLASLALHSLGPLAVAGLLGLFVTGLRLSRLETPRSWLPTGITALRGAMTAMLALAGLYLGGWSIAAVVFTVFALDGLDGRIARGTNSVSRLGGHLDGETDALLTAVVCVLLFLRGPCGAWVLTAGFLRYAYVVVVRFVPSQGLAPRSEFAARAFGIALTGLTLGFLPLGSLSQATPALATLLLLWSFGRSFYWSFKEP